MALELAGVTGRIIGAAIEVHRQLGPGFVESVYERALRYELDERGLGYEQQVEVPIVYRGRVEVGKHRLDLLVEKMIVVDLKAISELMDIHFAVVRSQLRAVGLKHGLLLNFAQVTLQAKRVMV
ncbi:MAG: GxxExxY protein [Verrucomicrobia bacterium]|jgi:GxxExxY protein|nr:GxxExxY protein [Verrucomicrobiota bacterium]